MPGSGRRRSLMVARGASAPSNPATEEQVDRVRNIAMLASELVRQVAARGEIPEHEVDAAVKKIAAECRKHEAARYPRLTICPDSNCHHSVTAHVNGGCQGMHGLCGCRRRVFE